MGRLNHENNVAIPGYGKPVLLSGDDRSSAIRRSPRSTPTSRTTPTTSGTMRASCGRSCRTTAVRRRSTTTTTSRSSSTTEHQRQVHPGPEEHRYRQECGRNGHDVGRRAVYPRAARCRHRQRDLAARPPAHQHLGGPGHRWPAVGPRALGRPEQRLPVHAYRGHRDRQATRDVQRRLHGRLRSRRESPLRRRRVLPNQAFTLSNGRVWKMVMSPTDPTVVTSLSILIEGDDNPVKTLNEIHQPDNLETTVNGLYVTEDPGSSQQFNAAQQAATPMRPPRESGSTSSAPASRAGHCGGPQGRPVGRPGTDRRRWRRAAGNWGAWESTGILDVSSIFGPGKFLVNVQAHTLCGSRTAPTCWPRPSRTQQARRRSTPAGHHPRRLTPTGATTGWGRTTAVRPHRHP